MAIPTFDFTGGILPAGASVTRSSVGTRFNAAGVMETISANLPRFDYDPVSLTLKGLLLEPSTTNLAIYSDQFDNAGWAVKTNVTVTADQGLAPTGTNIADLFDDGAAASTTHRVYGQSFTSMAQAYTYSVYVKAVSGAYFQLLLTDGTTSFYANFNAATGAAASKQASVISSSIVAIGGGIYRCTMTVAMVASASANYQIGLLAADTTSVLPPFTGANRTFYMFGAMLEARTGASSYIATTSAAVTRTLESVVLNWAALGVANGACYARLTYDDLTTSVISGTVASGSQTVSAASLARPWVKKVEYLAVPTVPQSRAVTLKDAA